MVIRRKSVKQQNNPSDAESLSDYPGSEYTSLTGAASLSQELQPGMGATPVNQMHWSQESIDSGLAPERRSAGSQNDRRRAYRRIEDKTLISKAHEEANAIREKAELEGFEAGLTQSKAHLESLQTKFDDLLSGRSEALTSVSGDIAKLAVEVASRIIKTEVTCDDLLVLSLVRDSIRQAGPQTKTIILKLNAADIGTVKQSLKENPLAGNQAEIIIVDDSTVDLGSCIIETNSGLIDARFSTQIGVLKKLLGIVQSDENSTAVLSEALPESVLSDSGTLSDSVVLQNTSEQELVNLATTSSSAVEPELQDAETIRVMVPEGQE
ncbi:MAG: FliH/SctL family protein [Cyanobacteria bacterium P01_H01_bin.74]